MYTNLLATATLIAWHVAPSFATFKLRKSIVGVDFFDEFLWENMDDPTHGRVNYVTKDFAKHTNLSYAHPVHPKFVMRADDQIIVPSHARGRNSVRIVSKDAWLDSAIVLDIEHMPEGCGTWPAFWTLSQAGPWPHGGEIDIIEGVNLNTQNAATLHTSANCVMPQSREQSGNVLSIDCDVAANYNQGCGVSLNGPATYGSGFNSARGGWYVLIRNQEHGAKIFFWSRNDDSVPPEVKFGSPVVLPNRSWGTPAAVFPSTSSCDFNSHFNAHQIVFDLTFCGDWSGNVWNGSGCPPGPCSSFVDNNPSEFTKAYWEINSLRIYTPVSAS